MTSNNRENRTLGKVFMSDWLSLSKPHHTRLRFRLVEADKPLAYRTTSTVISLLAWLPTESKATAVNVSVPVRVMSQSKP